jgi:hypothetical protein
MVETQEKVIWVNWRAREFVTIQTYAKATGFKRNFNDILRGVGNINPPLAQNISTNLFHSPDCPLVDVCKVMKLFSHTNLNKELSAVKVDMLRKNDLPLPHLKTRRLEILLMKRANIGKVLFGKPLFTEYDHNQ